MTTLFDLQANREVAARVSDLLMQVNRVRVVVNSKKKPSEKVREIRKIVEEKL